LPVGFGKSQAQKLRMNALSRDRLMITSGVLGVLIKRRFIQEKAPLVKKKLDKTDFSKTFSDFRHQRQISATQKPRTD
jgi:hypothetical protein